MDTEILGDQTNILRVQATESGGSTIKRHGVSSPLLNWHGQLGGAASEPNHLSKEKEVWCSLELVICSQPSTRK